MTLQLPGIEWHFQICKYLTRNSLSPSKQQKPQICSAIDKLLHEKKLIPYKANDLRNREQTFLKAYSTFLQGDSSLPNLQILV